MKKPISILFCLALVVACSKGQVKDDAPVTPQPAAQVAEEGHTNVQPLLDSSEGATKAFDHEPQPGEKAICAVSDEPFVITETTKTAQYEGKWYAFCCDECAPAFDEDPASYAQP